MRQFASKLQGFGFMAVFRSDEHFYAVLQQVFERVQAYPEQIAAFTHSNLVIRIQTSDPEAVVLLDGRQPPLEVFYGPRPGKANLEVRLPADLLHAIWMSNESASSAFFSGRIQTKGNFMKAMQLIDLFRAVEQVYPAIAAEQKLAD
jgi:putative sterol carrier protein